MQEKTLVQGNLVKMKVTELKKLKNIYIEKHQELLQTIQKAQFEIDVDGDEVDQIQGKTIINVQEQINKLNLRKLKSLETAIKNIDKKGYGICEECEEDIGFKRLAALPGITICICCAEQREREAKSQLG
jgi:DnaK suppressor protein